MHPLRMLAALLIGALLAGCAGDTPDPDAEGSDTLTRRQRDSIVGESGLPGASGVRNALDASDEAKSRAARIDSLSGN